MRKSTKRITTVMLVIAMFLLSIPVVTIAASSVISWNQKTNTELILNQYERSFGGSDVIQCEGVAKVTDGEGTFLVVLQKKNWIDAYCDIGNKYTIKQNSKQSYNLSTKRNVTGQFFRTTWWNLGEGTYRIVLRRNTNPSTQFKLTDFKFSKQ